jgi:hypothetical protein
MEKCADGLAMLEKTCAEKKPMPVVNVAAHERKSLSLGIGQIACSVHQALSEPDTTDRCFHGLPPAKKVHHARGWEEELPDRTPKYVKGFTQEREEEVAGFVKREIDPVDEVVLIGKDEPADIRDSGYDQKTPRQHMRSIGEPSYEP